jgi:hypothetical protein
MPRLRTKKVEPEVEAQWVVCTEAFGPVIGSRISRGEFRRADRPDVRRYPSYWRLLGPRPDEEGVNNGSE